MSVIGLSTVGSGFGGPLFCAMISGFLAVFVGLGYSWFGPLARGRRILASVLTTAVLIFPVSTLVSAGLVGWDWDAAAFLGLGVALIGAPVWIALSALFAMLPPVQEDRE